MTKLLVSDYDDTFYLNDEDISRNVELIRKKSHKLKFIIATGRSYYDYSKKRDKYNIVSEYVILNHGASIIKNDELILNIEIDNVIKNKLLKDLKLEDSIDNFGCSKKESRLSIQEDNLTKINIKYKSVEETLNIYNKISKKYKNNINCFIISHGFAIEIVNKSVNKKNAILKIIELENIDKKDVYTVGNGDTDYEMLKFFNGYAMQKSSSKINELNLTKVVSVSELIMGLSD